MKIKNRFTALVLALVMMLTLSGCGSGQESQPAATTVPTTVPRLSAEDIIEKAKDDISEGNGELDAYLAALDELAQLPEDAAEDSATEAFLLETLNTSMQLIAEEREGIYRPDEIQSYMDYLVPVIKLLNASSNQTLEKEKTKLLINAGIVLMDLNDTEYGLTFWKENSTATMEVLLEAIEILRSGKSVQAINYLRENLEDHGDYEYWAWSSFASGQPRDLVSQLDFMKAYCMMRHGDLVADEAWASEGGISEYWQGTIDTKNVEPLTGQDIQLLKENCGKEAAGKVLILNRKRPYNSQETVLSLDSHNYDLPESLSPERIEEVSYILLFDTDYEETGRKFNVGTALIKEISQITVYSVQKSKPLYQSDKRASVILPIENLMYKDEPPEYYSPDHPDMAEAAVEAMKRILKAIG